MNDLGDDLNRAAGAPEPELDVAGLQARARRRSVTKRRALVSGSMAVLLLAGGVAYSATRTDGGTSQQVTAGDGEGDDGETTLPTEPTVSTEVPTTEAPTTTVVEDPSDVTSTLVGPVETTIPTATTTPPTTVPPAASNGSLRVSGTYTGKEQYRLDTTECSEPGMSLSHVLASTFTPTHDADGPLDPTPWTYKSDYCSVLQGDRWSGSGSFAISLPGGLVTGTFTDSTAYPTDGEPYTIDIEDGDGRYAGATGGCRLTVHITDKAFGSQTQSGDFTCEITYGSASSAGTVKLSNPTNG